MFTQQSDVCPTDEVSPLNGILHSKSQPSHVRDGQLNTRLTTLFSRLDPRTIFFVFPCALTCVFLFSTDMLRDLLFILFLFTVLLIQKRRGCVAIWCVLLALTHLPLFLMHHVTFQYVFLAISSKKACMILCTGVIIFSGISVGDCINLMKKMKCGRTIIIPVAICFRFVPTLFYESGIIRDALKARRLYSAKHLLRSPLATFEIFLSTLLFRIFVLGEELTFSLSTRGLNFKGKNYYREPAFTYRDAIFTIGTGLYLIFVLYAPMPEITL